MSLEKYYLLSWSCFHLNKKSTKIMSRKREQDEIIINMPPIIRLYKNGRVSRLVAIPTISPALDPKTGVETKDIKISNKTNVYVRLFKPNTLHNANINDFNNQNNKLLPLILYFHGGGFCMDSTFSPKYHNYLNLLASLARVMIVSVEYRRTPEHRLPAAYHDCLGALRWAVSNITEEWLNKELVDLDNVYLMGDSTGANIAHQVALRAGVEGLGDSHGFNLNGVILVHPYFWGAQRIGKEAYQKQYLSIPNLAQKLWQIARPNNTFGEDHPWVNPSTDTRLSSLGCKRVLVCVAEEDYFRDRGMYYKESLETSGWQGIAQLVESLGEDHCFHLLKPSSASSHDLLRKVVNFIYPVLIALNLA